MQNTKVNLFTIGNDGDGKTFTMVAISKVLGREAVLDNGLECSYLYYQTQNRDYDITDFNDSKSCKNNIISKMDGAILVVDVLNIPEISNQLALIREANIPRVVVFLNKCDMVKDDDEYLALVEMDVRYQLSEYGFDSEDTPVIWGSALEAISGNSEWEYRITELVEAIDSWI